MSFGHALPQKLQASLCQIHDFAFVLLLELGLVLHLAICNVADMLNDIIGLTDETN